MAALLRQIVEHACQVGPAGRVVQEPEAPDGRQGKVLSRFSEPLGLQLVLPGKLGEHGGDVAHPTPVTGLCRQVEGGHLGRRDPHLSSGHVAPQAR